MAICGKPTMVLITGTTGFVGAHLATGLRKRSYRITEVNRRIPADNRDMIIWGFGRDIPDVFPREIDIIIHCASPVGVGSKTHAQTCMDVNVHATDHLLRYGEQAGAKLFVLVSSGAVYGLATHARNESEVLDPGNPYACSKAAGEFVVKAHEKSMRAQVLRLFYPYGPGQISPRLVPRLLENILRGQPIALNGADGRPRMNPLYIDDLVNWVIRLIETEDASGPYNLGGAETVSVRELAEKLGALLGRQVQFEYKDGLSGNTVGATCRAYEATGFVPEWTLDRGLGEVVKCATK